MSGSIRFAQGDLRRGLRVFKKAKVSSRDLLGRAMLLQVYEEGVSLCTTDGASYTEVGISAEVIGDWPESIVIHAQSLPLSLVGGEGDVVLVSESSGFYTVFDNGRLHVPTFNLSEDIFTKPGLRQPCRTWELGSDDLKYVFESLLPIISTPNQAPGLAFFFLSPQGVFCSNGAVICRVVQEYPEMVIRQRDLPTIQQVLASTSGQLSLHKFHDCYRVSCENLRYTFPELVQTLSSDWKSCPEPLHNTYMVEVEAAKHYIEILEKMPDSSGVAHLHFSEHALTVMGMTRKGEESNFTLSSEVDGAVRVATYPVKARTLLTALNVFLGDERCHIGISDRGLLQMFVKGKYLTVLLKAF